MGGSKSPNRSEVSQTSADVMSHDKKVDLVFDMKIYYNLYSQDGGAPKAPPVFIVYF